MQQPTPITLKDLPPVGAALLGGVFVGLVSQPDGQHAAVVLLPDRATGVTWQAATDWAASLGAQLPNRQMMASIYANTQDRPKYGWHWTCEAYQDDASCAWGCGFYDGGQFNDRKGYEGAAVAVRLIPLTA